MLDGQNLGFKGPLSSSIHFSYPQGTKLQHGYPLEERVAVGGRVYIFGKSSKCYNGGKGENISPY